MEALQAYASDAEEQPPEGSSVKQPPRVRNFPHVTGNYATHVYITGSMPS